MIAAATAAPAIGVPLLAPLPLPPLGAAEAPED